MTSQHETRATQSTGSQIADASFLLALLFVTLFVTTFVLADDAAPSTAETEVASIEELPIPAAEKAQFVKMQDLDMVDTATVTAAV